MVLHANPLRGIQLEVDSSYRARMRIERAIKICFAGPLAQQRYRPSSWRRHHGESDFERAADLALQVCGSGVQATAFLKWLEVTTREMVETRWTHIERVAARLLEVGSLNRNELLAAITLFGDGAVESNSVPRRHPMSPR